MKTIKLTIELDDNNIIHCIHIIENETNLKSNGRLLNEIAKAIILEETMNSVVEDAKQIIKKR